MSENEPPPEKKKKKKRLRKKKATKKEEEVEVQPAMGFEVGVPEEVSRFTKMIRKVWKASDIKRGEVRKEIDMYRDTPLRFLGYSCEIGEAIRPFVRRQVVQFTYLIAAGYIVADVLDKTSKRSETAWKSDKRLIKETHKAMVDAFAFQSLASIILPGVVVHRAVKVGQFIIKHTARVPKHMTNLTSLGITISLIPIMVKPLDALVDLFLDYTLRVGLKHRRSSERDD